MKLRDRKNFNPPELMIIPMIDIMFFLLVFFMLGTLYMIEQKSLPVKLPSAQNAIIDQTSNFTITIKKDGTLYIEDKQTNLSSLVNQAKLEAKQKPTMSIIIRADKDTDYGKVITIMDGLKAAGITRFGLATDKAGKTDG